MQTLATRLASLVVAIQHCKRSGNEEWREKHETTLHQLVEDYMPSGSGIDNGTTILLDRCTDSSLVFATDFHHMDGNGMYDGWTNHVVTVRASLAFGLDIRVSGRNRNDIKDYLGDVFHTALLAQSA